MIREGMRVGSVRMAEIVQSHARKFGQVVESAVIHGCSTCAERATWIEFGPAMMETSTSEIGTHAVTISQSFVLCCERHIAP